MTKPLKRTVTPTLYHFVDGKKCSGPNSMMSGDCSGLWGNLGEIPKDARPCDLADWVEEL